MDGIYQHTDLAIKKLRTDIAAFRRPSAPGYIAFVLGDTLIVCGDFGFVWDGSAFIKKLNNLLQGHGFAIKFFDVIELAKEWLNHNAHYKPKKQYI